MDIVVKPAPDALTRLVRSVEDVHARSGSPPTHVIAGARAYRELLILLTRHGEPTWDFRQGANVSAPALLVRGIPVVIDPVEANADRIDAVPSALWVISSTRSV